MVFGDAQYLPPKTPTCMYNLSPKFLERVLKPRKKIPRPTFICTYIFPEQSTVCVLQSPDQDGMPEL